MKPWLLFGIVLVQIVIVGYLAITIYKKKVSSGSVSGINIKKQNITSEKIDSLNYFYQPEPKSIVRYDKVPWMKEFDDIYEIMNHDGLNSLIEYSIPKEKRTYRIITIGDSFTFGLFVKTEENYPSKLEYLLNKKLKCKDYNKFEVINLGVGGYDLEYAAERLKLKGLKYEPDLVLWLIKDDDFQIINEYVIPKEKYFQKKMGITPNSPKYYFDNNSAYPTWQKSLERLQIEWGKEKILVYQEKIINQAAIYFPGNILMFTFPFTDISYRNKVSNLTQKIKTLSFYDSLTNIYDMKYFFPDKHPTAKGYEIIAEDLYNYLLVNKLIPCQ